MNPLAHPLEFLTLAAVSVAAYLAVTEIQRAREELSEPLLKQALSWIATVVLTTYLFVVIRTFISLAVSLGDVSVDAQQLVDTFILPAYVLLVFVSVYFTARTMGKVGQTFGKFREVGEDISLRMAQRKWPQVSPKFGVQKQPAR